MGKPMNYDSFAASYARTRWALPWILSPISSVISNLGEGSIIVDIGCGTGDYVATLSKKYDDRRFFGFDLANEMLDIARTRYKDAEFQSGNADEQFPYPDDFADMLYCVDVIHHLADLTMFFGESFRVLKNPGMIVIVTDSEDDIRGRSLSEYFPEVLNVELARYPSIKELLHIANSVGFKKTCHEETSGHIEIDEEFISKLDNKCSSALRLISDEAHRAGMERVKRGRLKDQKWLSRYTVLRFEK